MCNWLKENREVWESRADSSLPDGKTTDTVDGPCAICLEETVTNPVVLDCNHVFCFGCIGRYHYEAEDTEGGSLCPLCRREIPDARGNAFERAALYHCRALAEAEGTDKQKKYAELALAEYDALSEVDDEIANMPRFAFVKVRIMRMLGKPATLIGATLKIYYLLLQMRRRAVICWMKKTNSK